MPTDDAHLITLMQEIAGALEDVKSRKVPLSDAQRHELVKTAEKLAIAARDAEENLYFQATQVRSRPTI
jgi:hypothetical protein